MRYPLISFLLLLPFFGTAQETTEGTYKKRVLETTELQVLTSYYNQDGDFAAVSGGRGSEQLTDVHPTIIMAIPLNADDVITATLGVSVYSSASSSNINPFDGGRATPFQASSGASSGDNWVNGTITYTHSSDDRNSIWSAHVSGSAEYDYTSFGAGGSITRLMNEKNTELTLKASAYIDGWVRIYPIELRPFDGDGGGLNHSLFRRREITGNSNYNPSFTSFATSGRQSYNLGLNFSQLLSKKFQGSLALDLVRQNGILSTPFQRVYFADVADSFIEDFHLADDVERLPSTRTRIAIGGRLNAYLSERLVLRSFYRYYTDSWNIGAHTMSLEAPIKLSSKFTLKPGYRFYHQTAARYFAPYDEHSSTNEFYTSDYDLSSFNAQQYSLGISYQDLLAEKKLWRWKIKSVDLNASFYERDNGFRATQFAAGIQLVWD